MRLGMAESFWYYSTQNRIIKKNIQTKKKKKKSHGIHIPEMTKSSFWILCQSPCTRELSFKANWMAGSLAFAFHLVLCLEKNQFLKIQK